MNLPRQRQPVKVTLSGDAEDIEYYLPILKRAAEARGEDTNMSQPYAFTIYPRAVND